jgi:hypothetical protein
MEKTPDIEHRRSAQMCLFRQCGQDRPLPWEESGRYFLGMNKKLSLKNILAVRCPAYIAGPRGLVKAVLVK